MKQRLALTLTVFVSAVFLSLPSGVLGADPKIQVDKEEFDFGTIDAGEKVTHEFIFKNVGGSDLIITDVKTSCGCTAAVTSAKTIAPGESGNLKVTFDSKGRKGAQTKTITIVSNDPESPRTSMRLKGKIGASNAPEIQVHPTRLDMGVIEPGKPATGVVTITNMGASDLILEDFVGRSQVSVKNAETFIKKTIKPRAFVKIEVVANPTNLQGVFQGFLQIQNNSAQKTVTVPVYGYVSDKYILKPTHGSQTRTEPDR